MENSDEGQGVFSLGYRWSMLTKQRLGGFQRLGHKKNCLIQVLVVGASV